MIRFEDGKFHACRIGCDTLRTHAGFVYRKNMQDGEERRRPAHGMYLGPTRTGGRA